MGEVKRAKRKARDAKNDFKRADDAKLFFYRELQQASECQAHFEQILSNHHNDLRTMPSMHIGDASKMAVKKKRLNSTMRTKMVQSGPSET